MKITKKILRVAMSAMLLLSFASIGFAENNQGAANTDKEVFISPKAKHLELVLVLDKSGSMHGLESDTLGGLNALVDRERKLEIPVTVTTILFNNKYTLLHDRVDIKKVEPLTDKDYVTNGTTALYDAVFFAAKRLEDTPDVFAKGNEALLVVITDGLENDSREADKDMVKKKLSLLQEKNGLKVIYLGANIDVGKEAEKIGIAPSNAVKYKNTGKGVRANFEAVAEYSEAMAVGRSADESWKNRIVKDEE